MDEVLVCGLAPAVGQIVQARKGVQDPAQFLLARSSGVYHSLYLTSKSREGLHLTGQECDQGASPVWDTCEARILNVPDMKWRGNPYGRAMNVEERL